MYTPEESAFIFESLLATVFLLGSLFFYGLGQLAV